MQGFILQITKSIKEDVLVKLITTKHYYTLYRFYGARHSILYAGRNIDFEVEYQGIYIPKLRNIFHIAREYEQDLEKVYIWQQFCSLLDKHLQEPNSHEPKEIPPFYYTMLENGVRKLKKQQAKRVACCMYAELLEFEGRLYQKENCFICDNKLEKKIAITRGFLLAHPACVHSPALLDRDSVMKFYATKNLINFNNEECANLYQIVLEGL
ncbi:recombination protein RecO [Helicobacter aurati]|uniref:Recombination protein RecO n=1 Tax=Helicobacter aurati TaxID=137778 RepID=A0A3D8J6H4_9HELI|nr:recombination protein RecO [Helicobacter aurati]RDU73107.1 recombination protein RecO [Helicobacter aurati]